MRIDGTARRMTVFFGELKDDENRIQMRGTGFLITYRDYGRGFGYLVTARHVADRVKPHSDIVIRVNEKDGGAVNLKVNDIYWAKHPDDTVDIAVTNCALSKEEYDVAYYGIEDLVQPDEHRFRVECGDPICIVGLFHWHAGAARNTPIVHSGNIALLPDAGEKIPIKNAITGELQLVSAYLVEAQTFEGLSGAPVFQREVVALSQFPKHNGGHPITPTGAQLLGVYSGAWDGEPSNMVAADRGWTAGRRVPAGMGIVAPAVHILEIIKNDSVLKQQRADWYRESGQGSKIELG